MSVITLSANRLKHSNQRAKTVRLGMEEDWLVQLERISEFKFCSREN